MQIFTFCQEFIHVCGCVKYTYSFTKQMLMQTEMLQQRSIFKALINTKSFITEVSYKSTVGT